MEAFSQNDFHPSRRGLQPKLSQPFWVQLPDIFPTKVRFAKDIMGYMNKKEYVLIPSVIEV
jgi:hypothetical protein